MKPNQGNILGKQYTITYVDNPAEVDIFRRESLWGQLDYWTRSIRIYDLDRNNDDRKQTLLHEVLHGICGGLKLELNDDENTIAPWR